MVMVPIINAMEITNWVITRILRKRELAVPSFRLPLKTLIGLNDDRNRAGYDPAASPANSVIAMNIKINPGDCIRFRDSWLSVKEL